jgi:hypothetical protein
MASITSANATFMLSITGLFPVPVKLQGFAADDIFSTDPLASVETIMGVDGLLSAGFVFVEVKQGISLQADSPSNTLFDAWHAAQQLAKDVIKADGLVLLPSITTTWTLTKGFLTTYPPIPDGGKTLKPRKFGITWESVSPAIGSPALA